MNVANTLVSTWRKFLATRVIGKWQSKIQGSPTEKILNLERSYFYILLLLLYSFAISSCWHTQTWNSPSFIIISKLELETFGNGGDHVKRPRCRLLRLVPPARRSYACCSVFRLLFFFLKKIKKNARAGLEGSSLPVLQASEKRG